MIQSTPRDKKFQEVSPETFYFGTTSAVMIALKIIIQGFLFD